MARHRKRNSVKLSPQNTLLVDHFLRHGYITPVSALVNYGIARLASRVNELRKLGAPITTSMRKVNNKRYAHYEWGF